MELLGSDELRTGYLLLLVAAVAAGAGRFIWRRVQTDWADRLVDVLLLIFLIQYVSVALPGMLGLLYPGTIAAVTLALAAVLFFAPARASATPPPPAEPALDRWLVILCTLFLAGFCVKFMHVQRVADIMANDALVYHFPAAITWLQTHRLGLFETWFFNPANTYSPLAGSTLIAWWIAPLGNAIAAKYIQFWPLLLIYFASLRLMRALGARSATAALLSLGLVLSQALIRQAMIEKDDLYLTAFFLCAVAGCANDRLRDPLSPWRIGVAVGLMLATKYTALMALPVILLLADAPRRAGWGWRRHGLVVAVAALLAVPWFIRNWIVTGNPLYPLEVRLGGWTIFRGMFATARSEELSGAAAIWNVLAQRDQTLQPVPLLLVLVGYLGGAVASVGQLIGQPLRRTVIFGPVLSVAIFLLWSPYAEARFLYPALCLLMGGVAMALAGLRGRPPLQKDAHEQPAPAAWRDWLAHGLAAALMLVLVWTGLPSLGLAPLVLAALLTMIVGAGAIAILQRLAPALRRKTLEYAGLATVLGIALAVYLYIPANHQALRLTAVICWNNQYGELGQLWEHARTELPADATVAYMNLSMVYPLYGPEFRRRVVYVPTRPITHLHELPRIAEPLPGEKIIPRIFGEHAVDAQAWLTKLRASGAEYLAIGRAVTSDPVELKIIAAHPGMFEKLLANSAGEIFRILR